MHHVVYFPFPTIDDRDSRVSQKLFKRRYKEQNLVHTHVVWKATGPGGGEQPVLDRQPGALSPLLPVGQADDNVLIIDCHGNGDFLWRTDQDVRDPKRYRDFLVPEDLAKQLKLDGLPGDHKWIQLNVCLSLSFAKGRAQKLGDDYKEIWVGGVEHDVTVKAPDNQTFGCMLCGAELSGLKDGYRITGTTNVAWLSGASTYFDANGAPHNKLERRKAKAKEESRHYCPQCKKLLSPQEVGQRTVVNLNGRQRATVVCIVGTPRPFKHFDLKP